MSVDTSYEGNIGIIKTVAGRVYRRCLAARLPLEMDDCIQEATISWMLASRTYDEGKGSFTTYYVTSAYRHFNKLVDKYAANNFLQEIEGVTENIVDECEDDTPEMVTDRLMRYENSIRSLSVPSALVIKWLLSPPNELIEEIEFKEAKSADYKLAKGNYRVKQGGLNVNSVATFVVRLMGLESSMVGSIKRELRKFRRSAA